MAKTEETKIPAVTSQKTIVKKTVVKKTNPTADTTEVAKPATQKPEVKLTQGQKLLQAMTAQKAAKQALMKGVAKTHVTFDDEGNSNTETIVQKTVKPQRPAMKKPLPKKRKAETQKTKEETDEKDEKDEKKKEEQPKPVKKAPKKPKSEKKKAKIEAEEIKKDAKQEEALAYARLFVEDRSSWKFKKVLQIWLLQNLYTIPESEFSNVLEYIKDIQGTARDKLRKEAEEKIPAKAESTIKNTLTGYSNVSTSNDFDDFDAEKLLAQATMAPEPTAQEEEEEEEEESSEITRARQILKVLS